MKFAHIRQHAIPLRYAVKKDGSQYIACVDDEPCSERGSIYAAKRALRRRKRNEHTDLSC